MSPLVSTFAGAALRPYGFTVGAGGGAAFELISSTVLTSDTATVSFSSIVSTYKHLQLRITARSSTASGGFYSTTLKVVVNSDTGANYARHHLQGNGSAVSSGAATSQSNLLYTGSIPNSEVASGIFGASIIDILDYGSSSKNKTLKTLSGHHSASVQQIWLASGLWMSTSAISTITVSSNSGNLVTGSRISLYGILG